MPSATDKYYLLCAWADTSSSGYNFTTFDVIGDLAFGEAFGCLETGQYHPWIAMIFQSIKAATWLQTANFFPWVQKAILAFVPNSMLEKRKQHQRLTKEKLLKRINYGAERPDLIEGLLRKKEELGLSFAELQATSGLLIIAGSETTATLLSGVTYLLGTHPDALAKLTNEVRAAFKSEDEIDYVSVSNLDYMLACLDEALRIYPPAPLGIPREAPKGGGNVAGYYVPENVRLSPFAPSSYLAPLLILPYRRCFLLFTTRHITMRNSGHCPTSFTPSAGWEIRDLPTMNGRFSSPFMLGLGIVLERTWRISRCVSSWPEYCGTLTSSWRTRVRIGWVSRVYFCCGKSPR